MAERVLLLALQLLVPFRLGCYIEVMAGWNLMMESVERPALRVLIF